MAVLEPLKSGYYVWHYLPSIPAAAIFAVLFALSIVLLSIKMFRTKTYFVIPLLIGVILECIGYIFRIISHDRTSVLLPFIIQSIFLLVAPALYAASIYMVLGRLIRLLRAESYSLIAPRWMTKIFVAGDVFSFLVQSSGGGLMASANADSAKMGNNLIIAGLVIQIVLFGFFAVSAGVFHLRIRGADHPAKWEVEVKWERLLGMLYLASACILVRSVFRLIEYVQGQDGYLLRSEWTLYVFDAVLMWVTTIIFWWWYPAGITVSKDEVESGLVRESVPMSTTESSKGYHRTP
ncbi:hypothetical protein C1H76_2942 [Elsinoe australis]|uniref:Protein RTM1 n=1 Tax=Elsinoe australis TaxID=40998 RepID=A0A4U7BAD7_9PEZI|nr:hypothetical protein C1H76_2942 [Elsinoe australis]